MAQRSNRYKQLKRLVLLSLVVYPIFALGMTAVLRREFFPFAPWSMFMRVVSERESYEVRITEIGGESLASPRWLNESSQWIPRARSIAAWELIQEVGTLAESGAQEQFLEKRLFLERTYFRSNVALTYEITSCRSEVRKLWYGEPAQVERLIGRFHVENGARR